MTRRQNIGTAIGFAAFLAAEILFFHYGVGTPFRVFIPVLVTGVIMVAIILLRARRHKRRIDSEIRPLTPSN